MADVNRGNRPLSPHLSIYKPELNMVTSITHRITGVGLAVGAALIAWWLLAAATSDDYFRIADWVLTSWLGLLVLALCVIAFWYHFFNGLRHLIWDAGFAMESEAQPKTGWIVAGLAALMSLITFIAV